VTPSFNQGAFLEQTITSVLDQGYPNLEYFIVDGASSDDSLEIIRRYEKHLTKWISEPDRGPGHALNKGFDMATGDIFAWLNSDDYLLPGTLKRVADIWRETGVDLIYGDDLHVDEFSNVIDAGMLPAMPPRALMLFAMGCLHQESCFWSAAAHRRTGHISEDLFPGFDLDWFLRLSALPNFSSIYIRAPLAVARAHANQNIAALRAPGDNSAKRQVARARSAFIRTHRIPIWRLVAGAAYYGTWRRLHEAYVRRLGWKYVLHAPHFNTIRRMANFRSHDQ
jgi:glycosyltransferase involved in cell wall biosynthesis